MSPRITLIHAVMVAIPPVLQAFRDGWPDAEVSAVREVVRAEMCDAYPLDPPLDVDIGVGDDWNDAKR